jgi:hypothetical protein
MDRADSMTSLSPRARTMSGTAIRGAGSVSGKPLRTGQKKDSQNSIESDTDSAASIPHGGEEVETIRSAPEVGRKCEIQKNSALQPGPHDLSVIRGVSRTRLHDAKESPVHSIEPGSEPLVDEDVESRKLSEDPFLFPEEMPPQCMALIDRWTREKHNKDFPCSETVGLGTMLKPSMICAGVWKHFTKANPSGDILGARIYTSSGWLVTGDAFNGSIVPVLRSRRLGPWLVSPGAWKNGDFSQYLVWSGAPGDKYGYRPDLDIHRFPSRNQRQLVRASLQPQPAPKTRETRPEIDRVAEMPRVSEVARTATKRSSSSDPRASKRNFRLKASAGKSFQASNTGNNDVLSSDNESENDHGFPDCSHCGALTTRGKCHFRLTDHPLCKRCYQFRQKYGVSRPLEEESLSQTNARLMRSTPETVRRGHGGLEVGLDADDEEEGHVPVLQAEKKAQTSLTEIPESPKTPEPGYHSPPERAVDPERRSTTASKVYPTTPLSLSRKPPSDDKRGTNLYFFRHATNMSTRQKSIAACSTVAKLFAHAVAGGVFPPTMLPGSRVLSVEFEHSGEIVMLVEEDEEDFKDLLDLLDRRRYSDGVDLHVRAVS